MGLTRYKTPKAARQGMMEAAVSGSGSGSGRRFARTPRDSKAAALPSRSVYRSGLYRFTSWEEARRFDLEMMIRSACGSGKKDKRCCRGKGH